MLAVVSHRIGVPTSHGAICCHLPWYATTLRRTIASEQIPLILHQRLSVNNIAILVGNTEYDSLTNLSCCKDDLLAMQELLAATDRFSNIEVIENADADSIKTQIRLEIGRHHSIGELFFYFTGHGCQRDDDFYYCATGFHHKHPNTTGISTTELHELLRMARADLVVKVADACNSGTVLVKSGKGFVLGQAQDFKSFIQISSCLDYQNTLTGNPLSLFTEKFRESVLRKTEGEVYYSDIVYALRDEFIENDEQTPFFVSQGTGREQFVDDAKRFDALRAVVVAQRPSSSQSERNDQEIDSASLTFPELLAAVESGSATRKKIESFVDGLFDGLQERVSSDNFSEFFEMDFEEHPDFMEESTDGFIVRVLSTEYRSDGFVTAEKQYDRVSLVFGLYALQGDRRHRESFNLRLNCDMKRAQLKFTMTPKFHSLKQLTLVVTCAPSLEQCYVFVIVCEHSLEDFGRYDPKGREIVRRWHKFNWDECTDRIVGDSISMLEESVRNHLERTQQRLTERQ